MAKESHKKEHHHHKDGPKDKHHEEIKHHKKEHKHSDATRQTAITVDRGVHGHARKK